MLQEPKPPRKALERVPGEFLAQNYYLPISICCWPVSPGRWHRSRICRPAASSHSTSPSHDLTTTSRETLSENPQPSPARSRTRSKKKKQLVWGLQHGVGLWAVNNQSTVGITVMPLCGLIALACYDWRCVPRTANTLEHVCSITLESSRTPTVTL